MTEVAEAPVQQQAEGASAGTLLRRAREAAGMHVAAVAVALKVPVRKLEALEDDRWQDLGDAVFVRALASSVCRTLKVDPQPILDGLPQTAAPRLVRDTDGLNAPFRAPGDGPAPTWLHRIRQPVPAAVIALLAAAVVIYFLPAAYRQEKATAVESAPAAAAPAPAPVVAAAPAPAPAADASSPVVPQAAPVAPPATIVAAAAPAAPMASAAAAAPAPAAGIVLIRTHGDSWVEVVDAKGTVALRKLMGAGEAAGADGALPLTVTIGKADMTEVEVRGRKFDLRPVARDNVARFEVK
jgi:cytoskeleton protein RodZ